MARPIGLAALTVLELRPPDQVACAAAAGFSHVGLRLIPATPDDTLHPMIGDTAMAREVAQRLVDTGVKVLDIEIFRLRPHTRVQDYAAAFDAGARLGAKHALVAGNDPDEARLIDNFAAICELAARFELTADLEPMPWTDARSVPQAARIVAAAGRANGGVLVDAIHWDRSAGTPDDIRAVPPGRLRYAQLCDAPAERPTDTDEILRQARTERLFPGEGGLDLRGMLRALPPDIPLSLEIPTLALAKTVPAVERARRALAATRALLAALAAEER